MNTFEDRIKSLVAEIFPLGCECHYDYHPELVPEDDIIADGIKYIFEDCLSSQADLICKELRLNSLKLTGDFDKDKDNIVPDVIKWEFEYSMPIINLGCLILALLLDWYSLYSQGEQAARKQILQYHRGTTFHVSPRDLADCLSYILNLAADDPAYKGYTDILQNCKDKVLNYKYKY